MIQSYYLGDYNVSDYTKPIQTKLKMPIEWMVLEKSEDGKVLLYSRNILDWEMYDSKSEISWDDSFIKRYLGKLYDFMFTDEEKEAIISGQLGSLFLLSEEAIKRYLPTEESRRAIQYFVEMEDGEMCVSLSHSTYWLRSDKCLGDEVPLVDSLGKIDFGYGDADETGIRVAMWVDVQKARALSAKKGYDKCNHYWEPEEF